MFKTLSLSLPFLLLLFFLLLLLNLTHHWQHILHLDTTCVTEKQLPPAFFCLKKDGMREDTQKTLAPFFLSSENPWLSEARSIAPHWECASGVKRTSCCPLLAKQQQQQQQNIHRCDYQHWQEKNQNTQSNRTSLWLSMHRAVSLKLVRE